MTILVTGSADFIGTNFVLDWLVLHDEPVVSLDKLAYADNRWNLANLDGDVRHIFITDDIGDSQLVARLLAEHQPRAILNSTAKSHVDCLIHGPKDFIQTNIVGTFRLLEGVRAYWGALEPETKAAFCFLYISTDEAYGSLAPSDPTFTENNRYEPNSPYLASEAASDHLVRAYHHTYGLPVLTTNCPNNYGPHHFSEKLIPLVTHNVLADEPLPIYSDGQQIHDWPYIRNHRSAIRRVLEARQLGEIYDVGGWDEEANLSVAEALYAILDQKRSCADDHSCREQITFIKDHPDHDRRYTIGATCLERELGWKPAKAFETDIRKIVRWYLDNQDWVANVASGVYREWVGKRYV